MTCFTPFQLVYKLEVFLPIECEIPSLKLAIKILPNNSTKEECFLYLTNLNKTRWDASLDNESHKKWIRAQYYKAVQPPVFNEGDMVLTYDKKHDKLGKGKMESMWYGPYIIIKVFEKGSYELVDYDGIPFREPQNGLYLKRYYA